MKALLNYISIFFCILMLKGQDLKTNTEITSLLNDKVTLEKLHYPKSVVRFYSQNQSDYAWIMPSRAEQTWTAMLLLDCAYQLGLSSSDYHLQNLSFENLGVLKHPPENISPKDKAMQDILITDALISLINNLHFGKYNPFYTVSQFDKGFINGFYSVEALSYARGQNDFIKAILQARPKIQAYTDFQNYLNKLYANNPENHTEEIKKILINMERLRWLNTENESYILVNIPSYTLEFYSKKKIFESKVIVGKPSTKSPVLVSDINYFTTAPDWKVPQSIFVKEMLPKIMSDSKYLENHHYAVYNQFGGMVTITPSKLREIRRNPYKYSVRQSSGCDNALGSVVFRFPNSYGVYLHDTSQKQLFNKTERALSHGCIRVEKAQELASLLLKNDGAEDKIPALQTAMQKYDHKDFVLKQPVPINIAYLTCMIKDGKPVFYNDIYHLDADLENKFNLNKQ